MIDEDYIACVQPQIEMLKVDRDDWKTKFELLKRENDKLKEDYADLNCHYAAALDKINELENPWVSVEDRLPEIPKPDEGYYCFLVSDGSLIHMAYYTEDGWLFADSGEKKEMFYEVTHWCDLPDYPNHQRSDDAE